MRYWPVSMIATNPKLHHSQVWELMCAAHVGRISNSTLQACNYIAGETVTPVVTMALMPALDAVSRCGYMHGGPAAGEFEALERVGFIATEDTFGMVIDTLH